MGSIFKNNNAFQIGYYSMCSGGCAALASTFGKLSGLDIYAGPFIVLRFILFGLLAFNAGVWTFYTKALQTTSTFSVTVLSAAFNYFLSAVLGIVIFHEVMSFLWSCGMILVLFGIILITRDELTVNTNKNKKRS